MAHYCTGGLLQEEGNSCEAGGTAEHNREASLEQSWEPLREVTPWKRRGLWWKQEKQRTEEKGGSLWVPWSGLGIQSSVAWSDKAWIPVTSAQEGIELLLPLIWVLGTGTKWWVLRPQILWSPECVHSGVGESPSQESFSAISASHLLLWFDTDSHLVSALALLPWLCLPLAREPLGSEAQGL